MLCSLILSAFQVCCVVGWLGFLNENDKYMFQLNLQMHFTSVFLNEALSLFQRCNVLTLQEKEAEDPDVYSLYSYI